MKTPEVEVSWDDQKRRWQVRIQVGEEVIKRHPEAPKDVDDEGLRALAVHTTKDEGYDVEPSRVTVQR